MANKVLITGNSSGIGRGLSEHYLDEGREVYGISRRGCDLQGKIQDIRCDLADFEAVPTALASLLEGVDELELVVLNAGVLGEMRDLSETAMDSIRSVMEINVWSNKVILDWLLKSGIRVRQIVLISSGAAVNGSRGWGAYSLSKATLNMLTQLYAHEFPDTHLAALAPGLVDTAMQDFLCDPQKVDKDRYPSVQKLRNARGTSAMPKPREAGRLLAGAIPRLLQLPTGSFADIRTM